jgi:hypothetical protein
MNQLFEVLRHNSRSMRFKISDTAARHAVSAEMVAEFQEARLFIRYADQRLMPLG